MLNRRTFFTCARISSSRACWPLSFGFTLFSKSACNPIMTKAGEQEIHQHRLAARMTHTAHQLVVIFFAKLVADVRRHCNSVTGTISARLICWTLRDFPTDESVNVSEARQGNAVGAVTVWWICHA